MVSGIRVLLGLVDFNLLGTLVCCLASASHWESEIYYIMVY